MPTQRLGEVSTTLLDAHRSLLRQLLYHGDAQIAADEAATRKADLQKNDAALAALDTLDLPATEHRALQELRPILKRYRATRDEALRLDAAGQDQARLAKVKEALALNKQARAKIAEASAIGVKASRELKASIGANTPAAGA